MVASAAGDLDTVIQDVRNEKARWKSSLLVDGDPYAGDATIGIEDVLNAHFLLIEYFAKIGEGVGGIGPKSPDLLHSALSRQFSSYGGKPRWQNRIEIVATLMLGLIKNHAFHDANKRTAFLVSMLHLQKIGRTPKVDGQVFEDFTVSIADGSLKDMPYKTKAGEDEGDKEIFLISEFLRKHTREIDLRTKLVTYNELLGILRKFGFDLENPKGNRIDLVRVRDDNGIYLPKSQRIAHIGFHGWTREVSRKDIHIVRHATHLTVEDGYDAQSFFNGFDDALSLISKYEEPLRRLAYR